MPPRRRVIAEEKKDVPQISQAHTVPMNSLVQVHGELYYENGVLFSWELLPPDLVVCDLMSGNTYSPSFVPTCVGVWYLTLTTPSVVVLYTFTVV